MDFIKILERLMVFMCDKYEKDDIFRQYGECPWTLIEESGIELGDTGAQLAVIATDGFFFSCQHYNG